MTLSGPNGDNILVIGLQLHDVVSYSDNEGVMATLLTICLRLQFSVTELDFVVAQENYDVLLTRWVLSTIFVEFRRLIGLH